MFTVCSVLCGLAPTLPTLILARILQGLGGGGLAPSEQAILTDTFPTEKRGQAFALYGMAVVAAPAIGPTLGGWITDNYNWHWIFFINVPFGLLSLWLSHRMVEDPPEVIARTKRRAPVDFVGLAAVAVGVGMLEFTLDKGQQKDWFGSGEIQITALLAICALIFFIIWEWNHPDPIVDLKLLKNRNFGTAVFLQLILGAMLYGSTILIPQYLQTLLGYTAERAGLVLSPGGLVMMMMMVVAGVTTGKGDPRLIVMLGYLAVAAGLYNYTRLDLYTSYGTVTLWRMLQVIGLAFIFIPISTLNYLGVPRDKFNQISSLSTFARNMGGSAGTALLTTFLARSQQVQQTTLVSHLTPGSYALMSQISRYAALMHETAAAASGPAMALIYGQLQRQAGMLAYRNTFAVLSFTVALLSPLVWIMRLPPKHAEGDPEQMAAH
jgi:DHA2 family multidrug resistance protein